MEAVAVRYARRQVGAHARVVYVESRDEYALAAIDLGNTHDSLRYGSVLCRHDGRRWVAVDEPIEWLRHGHTNPDDGIAQLSVDFVDTDATSVTLANGVVRVPIDGRLFRVRWYLCRPDEVPFQRVESIRIGGRDAPPLTEWTPASADFIMDLVLNEARGDEPYNERLRWANDVHVEATTTAVSAVVAAWLTRLDAEDDPDVRAEIATGPLWDIVSSRPRAALRPVMDAARRSARVRTALRDADLPCLSNTDWQVLDDLLASSD